VSILSAHGIEFPWFFCPLTNPGFSTEWIKTEEAKPELWLSVHRKSFYAAIIAFPNCCPVGRNGIIVAPDGKV